MTTRHTAYTRRRLLMELNTYYRLSGRREILRFHGSTDALRVLVNRERRRS